MIPAMRWYFLLAGWVLTSIPLGYVVGRICGDRRNA